MNIQYMMKMLLMVNCKLENIQGYKNYWYCGAWTGNGFHEAGLTSSLIISDHLNGVIPWH